MARTEIFYTILIHPRGQLWAESWQSFRPFSGSWKIFISPGNGSAELKPSFSIDVFPKKDGIGIALDDKATNGNIALDDKANIALEEK